MTEQPQHGYEQAKEAAKRFLKAHFIAVIASAAADTRPEAATIYYWMDDDWNIFFMTRRHSRKFSNFSANPHAAMVVGTDFQPLSIQLEGTVRWLSDAEEADVFLQGLQHHPNLERLYHGDFLPRNPFPKIPGSDFAMFQMKIDWLRWMDISGDNVDVHYHQIFPEPAR